MITDSPLRILVVDDSVAYRKIVSDVLSRIPDVEVVGTAANGRIAMQKIEQLHPDLLTLDLEMPEMDGLEVLRRIKEIGSDTKAIMLSGATSQAAKATIAALALGAFDFVLKPTSDTLEKSAAMLRQQLSTRLQAFSCTKSVHSILHGKGSTATIVAPPPPPAEKKTIAPPKFMGAARPRIFSRPAVVVLGISTGGPPALNKMLPRLPANLRVPVLIVQHMPPVFTKSLADDLNGRCAISVAEACDGQAVKAGQVLIAPGGKQMKIVRENNQVLVRITDDPPENSCRPAVDYLFRSVVDVYGGNAIGVIMTGMGNDGTRGCRDMKRQGATIMVQDEASCVVYGMPKGPADEGVADLVTPLDSIAAEIVRLVG